MDTITIQRSMMDLPDDCLKICIQSLGIRELNITTLVHSRFNILIEEIQVQSLACVTFPKKTC